MHSGLLAASPFGRPGGNIRQIRYQPSGGPVAETSSPATFARDVVVIGGCGHVGLPLAVAFASRGLRVGIFDISEPAVACVNSARMPFAEPGAKALLEGAIAAGTLEASADPAIVSTGEHVLVVIGTPVGEKLEPDQSAIPNALQSCAAHLGPGQILILRSTVYPGVTARARSWMIRGPRTCPAPDSRPARAYSRTQCSSPHSITTTLPSATPRWPLMRGCRFTWWPAWSSVSIWVR